MAVDADFVELFANKMARPQAAAAERSADAAKEADEDRCPAYGYVRGTHERTLAIEFRLRDGNSEFFPYALLGPWRFNPSVGLLLQFSGGDALSAVLIRGSNLSALVSGTVNLTDRGIQRHRIVYVREMDEDELRQAGPGAPTIDRIEIAECASHEEWQDFLKTRAPAFAR